jgi:hypothetical protein
MRLEKINNKGFYNLHSSPNMIRMIKSRRKRWAGHIARIGEMIHILKGTDYLGYTEIKN